MPLDDAWVGLVDDAAIFPPGDRPLTATMTAYRIHVLMARWFTSFGSCSVAEPGADLRGLGLV